MIAGAGVRLLTTEPPALDDPLWSVLPNGAWVSEEAMQTLWDPVVCHSATFLAEEPTNVVQP